MKPYDKSVINRKIAQALVGVTAFGTILAMPISIDFQDNNMSIVRDNKAFAADTNAENDIIAYGDIKDIEMGGSSTEFLIKNDGTVWASGSNNNGQLGVGSTKETITDFTKVQITNVKKVYAKSEYTVFLKNDGTVWTCGRNYYGQLGVGNYRNQTVPTKVDIDNVKEIVLAESDGAATFFIKNDNTVWCCGSNEFQQLGIGSGNKKNTPTKVLINDVKEIKSDRYRTYFLKNDGTVWFAGLSNNNYVNTPSKKLNISNIKKFGGDIDYIQNIYFIENDDSVWVTETKHMNNIKKIETCSNYLYCFLKNDGTLLISKQKNGDEILNEISNVKDIKSIDHSSVVIFKNDGTVWIRTSSELFEVPINNVQKVFCSLNSSSEQLRFLKNDGTLWRANKIKNIPAYVTPICAHNTKEIVDRVYNLGDMQKYGSWSTGYYGKDNLINSYVNFSNNTLKVSNLIVDKDKTKAEYVLPNGWIITIDNYGMVNWYKDFNSTNPDIALIDGNSVSKIELGHVQNIGVVPFVYHTNGDVGYINPKDNNEVSLNIKQNEIKDTLVYHDRNNNSTHYLFQKLDGNLVYIDKDNSLKSTQINMNDVETIIPSTNARSDYFLMKDGTLKTLTGNVTIPDNKTVVEILSNRFVKLNDNVIYSMQGTALKSTNTMAFLYQKSINDVMWLKNGSIFRLDGSGNTNYLKDIDGNEVKTLVKVDENNTFVLMKDLTTKSLGDISAIGDLKSKDIDYNEIAGFFSNNTGSDKILIVMNDGVTYNYQGNFYNRVHIGENLAKQYRESNDFTFDDTESKDKEAPEIDLTGIPSDWTNKDFTVKVTATDNTKVKSIKLPDGTVVNGDTGTFTIKENGTYSFVAEDEAGNTKTKELKVSNIDKVAPTKPSITRIEDSIKITEGKDNESGIKQTLYRINNGNWIDLKDFNLDNLVTGENVIYAKSIDKAGNESEISEFKLTIEDKDKEAPTLEITGNPVDWTNKDIILNVSAKDNKKVKSITLPDGKIINGDKTAFTVNKNGTYKFIVEDEAGNKTTKEIVVNRIDKELPMANINIKDNKMTIVATDNLSGIKEILYKIDDGEFIRYAGEVTLSPGAHKIKVKAIDNAGNMNDQNSSSSEINVNVEDEGKKNLEDATKAVEKAENSQNQDDVDKAREKVNKLPDGKEKDNLNDRLDEVQNKINEKKDQEQKAKEEKEAKDAVEKAENSQNQDDVDKAKEKVNKLPDGKEKDNLNNRLDEVQDKINKKKDQEQKLKEEKEAKDAVEKAEKTKKDEDIKDAENKVSKLEDGKVKDDLTSRLDDLEKQIKAEKDAYIKAYNAVKKAKSTLDKEDYEYAKKAVHDLNTTIYKNEKTQLQRVLDALKPYIDRKETQSKQEERNQIRNIESLIRKAIATKDPKTIEEAQAAIDKLESSDIKIELQKRLDTTNKMSQMDLAIQARDAVEKLDAYLNYSDIINNLNEFKDLYKEAEKSTNRLDNSSQYKSRMDKAKGYIEVIETLTKYKENAEKNNILASEKEMTELISKANQLSFTTRNKQNIIKEILQFQKQLKDLSETIPSPEA
ncbi:hypothetical protein FDE98_15060 [Clostridium sporogenes]|uniref:OmpL47-type beta-barrel domain-containing protein n=1 Tax=Clostridium sporogenes TaxID=1509 RepID=UPI0013D1E983|nr:hypothetical protein [Clostridium sporogenes]NFV77397.1 hypothetical protein [Clostridium sporogenes]